MHNLLLEFYFKIFCTSYATNLLLLILFFPRDISYNEIVLLFLCVLGQIKIFWSLYAIKFCVSQNGANPGDMLLFHNFSPV